MRWRSRGVASGNLIHWFVARRMSICIGGAIGEKTKLAFGLIEEGK
jgi:hypothetical protein